MTPSWSALVAAAMSATLLFTAGTTAQQATPAPPPRPVALSECTVEPRTPEELRALTARGISERLARAAASPTAEATPGRTEHEDMAGEPADQQIAAAIEESARELLACLNGGNQLAILALRTDDSAARSLGAVAIFTGYVAAGGTGTPPPDATPAPDAVDAFLARLAVPVLRPAAEQQALVEVRDVVVLPDGRVRATVVTASEAEPEPDPQTLYFREVNGRYLQDVAGSTAAAVATPAKNA